MAKEKIVAFKATEDEAQAIRTIASQLDISVSSYIRDIIFKQVKRDVNKWAIDLALDTEGKPVYLNGVRIK